MTVPLITAYRGEAKVSDVASDKAPVSPQERHPTTAEILCRASEIWQERERELPEHVRRMKPDKLDLASGAWDAVLLQTYRELTTHAPD